LACCQLRRVAAKSIRLCPKAWKPPFFRIDDLPKHPAFQVEINRERRLFAYVGYRVRSADRSRPRSSTSSTAFTASKIPRAAVKTPDVRLCRRSGVGSAQRPRGLRCEVARLRLRRVRTLAAQLPGLFCRTRRGPRLSRQRLSAPRNKIETR
jgi:hypothetical protein